MHMNKSSANGLHSTQSLIVVQVVILSCDSSYKGRLYTSNKIKFCLTKNTILQLWQKDIYHQNSNSNEISEIDLNIFMHYINTDSSTERFLKTTDTTKLIY